MQVILPSLTGFGLIALTWKSFDWTILTPFLMADPTALATPLFGLFGASLLGLTISLRRRKLRKAGK